MSSDQVPPSTPRQACAVPLTVKRTPSRTTFSNTLSTRKRRRVSIPSFDLEAELGIPASTELAVEETDADRFVAIRSPSSIPLHTTPRTNRIAKSFGLSDDRVLTYAEGPASPSETKLRSLLRRSVTELFNIPRSTSSVSAKANLGARKQFVMALDGPGISRDPFAFSMTWSRANCIGVAFRSDVYCQNLETREIVHLCRVLADDGPVHSIDWRDQPQSHILGLGTTSGKVRVWDALSLSLVADWSGDGSPVGGMHWNESVLAVGRKDGRVSLYDLRTPEVIREAKGHKRHVHGVKWSPDGKYLATGDHSGNVHIWDQRAANYLTIGDKKLLAKHNGPVKAISWSPWQGGLVATGGTFPDGSIQIFDVNKISTVSPPLVIGTYTNVTSLHWSSHCKELLSTHGSSWTKSQTLYDYPPSAKETPTTPFTNSMTVHSYPSCERVVSVVGHSAAIAHSCIGPDGCSIFTVSPAEETIKMFRVWAAPGSQAKDDEQGLARKNAIR
ncbi:WD40 repeat-like protein [Boletus edulis BED1]|uniref:WD40 repeat-like protein n=1 Tax=Boletus edulis BED1 TaxID=1328754 RepID=A0AAD4BV77_BOLED|nr:WD40 repeat-like protein [Boletus edulis BED1]